VESTTAGPIGQAGKAQPIVARRRTPFPFVGRLSCALAWAALIAGCGGGESLDALVSRDTMASERSALHARLVPSPHASVLLITIDTCRSDRLGCYGNPRIFTPHLDALARRGVLFAQAVCQAPTTLPSHCSILTGLYPTGHGVRDNGRFRLGDDAVTLAEVLRDAGYATGAFVGAFPVAAQFGLAQGFDVYSDELPRFSFRGQGAIQERPASAVTDAALRWIGALDGGPFFAWVHYFDPHWPYDPPPVAVARRAETPYDGEIAVVDAQIGRLLDGLEDAGLAERSIVVAMSDHGEGLGEHSEYSHSVLVYDGTLRIPLVVGPASRAAGPGGPPLVVASQARSVDVMPTMLDLVAVAAPSGLDGVSLRAVPGASVPLAAALSYTETFTPWYGFQWSPLRGLRTDRWKFIEAPQSELYDLEADPRESANLLERHPRRGAAWTRALGEVAVERARSTEADMDAETAEKLRALGYVGAGRKIEGQRPEGANPDLPNPSDMIDIYFRCVSPATEMFGIGDFARSVAYADSAIALDPTNLQALLVRAHALNRLGRLEEAHAAYVQILDLDPESIGAHFSLGALLHRTGDPAGAERAYRAVLSIEPGIVEAQHDLALALHKLGRDDEAEAFLKSAIEADPDFAPARRSLGSLYYEQGRTREALRAYLGALAVQPVDREVEGAVHALAREDTIGADALRDLEAAWRSDASGARWLVPLAQVAFVRGDAARARRLIDDAIRRAPSAALYRVRAWMHRSEGRADLARRDLEAAVAVEPDNATAWANLGAFLRTGGDMDGARHAYEQALAIDDRLDGALVGLGIIHAEWRQLGRAMELWQRALALNPESVAGQNLARAQQSLEERKAAQ
jgi:arylsulfatase A-like enzyme/Tfp pilus assembly protein PilF